MKKEQPDCSCADYSDEEKVPEETKKVGIAYDERMLLHKSFLKKHPERPERLVCVMAHLISSHLLNKCKKLIVKDAPIDTILAAHSESHLDRLKSTQYDPNLALQGESADAFLPESKNTYRFSKETYENYYTYKASLISAGCVISGIDAMYSKKKEEMVGSVFCINRPSGHHAGIASIGGFCFLNNAAIAAKYAQSKYGIKKVAIIDWDVHHGNGTQDIVNTDDTILFVSLHRHDKGFFYPSSGDCKEVGKGKGEGFKVNIPWDTPGGPSAEGKISDLDYVNAFNEIVLPVTKEFRPELIIISAGFDAMKGDKLGKIALSPWVYHWMTKAVLEINPKILVTLEGGYNLKMLTKGVDSCLGAMLGTNKEMPKEIVAQEPSKEGIEAVEKARAVHAKYWKCLKAGSH